MFQQALQAARIEAGKPKSMRMDWNHKKSPCAGPKGRKSMAPKNLKREREEKTVLQASPCRLKRGFKLLSPADPEVGAQSASLMFSIENILGTKTKKKTNSQN